MGCPLLRWVKFSFVNIQHFLCLKVMWNCEFIQGFFLNDFISAFISSSCLESSLIAASRLLTGRFLMNSLRSFFLKDMFVRRSVRVNTIFYFYIFFYSIGICIRYPYLQIPSVFNITLIPAFKGFGTLIFITLKTRYRP